MTGFSDAIKSLVGRAGKALNSSDAQAKEEPLEARAQEWIEQKWTELKNAYIVYHQSIWETLLFYAGVSRIDWDKNRKVWQPTTPQDEWVPQPKINRFSPAIDAVASNFAGVPEIEAVAAGDSVDVEREGIAWVASKLVEHAIKDNALRADYRSDEDKAGYCAQLFVLAGGCFTVVYPEDEQVGQRPQMGEPVTAYTAQCPACDKYFGPMAQAPEACPECGGPVNVTPQSQPQPVLDDSGQPVMEPVTKRRVCCRVGNPLYAFPRPGSTSMQNNPYMLWAERRTLDEIYERWNYEADADTEYPDGYTVTYEHALNYYYTGFSSSTVQSKDSALVIEAMIEPGMMKDWPDGLYAVMVNHKCIFSKTFREYFVEHPLTKFDYMQLPTLFFGRSVAFDLVGIQRELDSYESLIKLHAMTSAVEPILQDENTRVSEITGRADKVIKWRSIGPGSQPPSRLQHGTLDAVIYDKVKQLHEEIENIAATVAVFRGQQPGGTTAASAIAQLRGQAEMMFGKPVQNWNNGWKETARKIVKCYQKWYTLAQLIEIVGPDHLAEVQDFIQADLDTVLEFVATATGLPRTRDEKRQEMIQLFDRGALDVNDAGVRQKMFELFGETGMLQQFNKDAKRARAENEGMKKGIPPRFMPEIEDLSVHFALHSEAIKSLDFDRLPPEVQQLMLTHALETRQALQAQAAPTPQGQANASPPAPPPAPAAPGPSAAGAAVPVLGG